MAKKALFIKLLNKRLVSALAISGFVLSMSMLVPAAQASVFSFLGLQTKAQTLALVSVPNSQTISLPEAQMGVNGIADADKADLIVENNALATDAGPLGTHADTLNSDFVTTDAISVYVVKEGDTLPIIAKMYGVSTNTIIWANDLAKGAKVTPGSTLVILPVSGISYTIKKGDTLLSIAKKFKADAADIGKYNGLESDSPLTPGDSIIIPDGEISTATTAVATSTKTSIKTNSQLPLVAYGATRYLPGHDGADLGSYFIRPVHGCVRTQGLHGADGVDIGCPVGTTLYAAASGTVIIAKDSGWNGGFGDYVVIQHPNGIQTLYGHMSRVDVSPGQTVSQGDVIGAVGKTGRATGPHVHFEVHGAKNPLGDNPNFGL
jgi:LysM repeat protein